LVASTIVGSLSHHVVMCTCNVELLR